jgi:hypothetical protein
VVNEGTSSHCKFLDGTQVKGWYEFYPINESGQELIDSKEADDYFTAAVAYKYSRSKSFCEQA